MDNSNKLQAILDRRQEGSVLVPLKVNFFLIKGEAPLGEYDVGFTDIAKKIEIKKNYL